jgi:hypothetical protein
MYGIRHRGRTLRLTGVGLFARSVAETFPYLRLEHTRSARDEATLYELDTIRTVGT